MPPHRSKPKPKPSSPATPAAARSRTTIGTPTANEHQIAIADCIRRLVPSTEVKYSELTLSTLQKRLSLPMKALGVSSNTHCTADWAIFWFRDHNKSIHFFEISRSRTQLTRSEQLLLKYLPHAVEHLVAAPATDAIDTARRVAGRLSFENILVTRFLRKHRSSELWATAILLQLLQDLTFSRYEGVPCTSGFVFAADVDIYLSSMKNPAVGFVPFHPAIQASSHFFDSPTSHRYVDGRNSFYLIDSLQHVHGVLSLKDPHSYTIVDRCNSRHISPLLEQIQCRTWAGYIGLHSDVRILTHSGRPLTWHHNHWKIRDPDLVLNALKAFGCVEQVASTLTDVLFALSDLHMGAAILIPADPAKRPAVAGYIDRSDVGSALRNTLATTNLVSLARNHSVLSVLSSDGLTTISKDGSLVGVGEIIDIAAATKLNAAGGGRTQAALIAGTFGLGIKVSEDGPISIYDNKGLLVKL